MSVNDRVRKLCRICGDTGSINIFGSKGQSLELADKINTQLPTNVTLNDHLSTMICDACVTQINTINHISVQGVHTNELMIKLLEKNDRLILKSRINCKVLTFHERMLKLCRICGNLGQLDIYNECIDNSVNLADKINSFLSIQVCPDDQLSLKICQRCCNKIEDVFPIFEFCQNTTKIMSMIAGNMTLDALKINAASLQMPNFYEEKELTFNVEDNFNKENESDNFDEQDYVSKNPILIAQETIGNITQTQCLRCTETFTSGGDLRRHILLNHNLKDLDCHHCFRRCANVLEFENHVQLHFPAENSYYPCDLCSSEFMNVANLVRHIKTHSISRIKEWALAFNLPHNSVSFGCQYCDKIFLLEASRRIHERTHLKYFICETCGKQLPNKSQLSVHQRQHTGERPYICSHCHSTFKCLSTLRQHEVVHSEKKYSCEVCLRKFSRPEKVRIHMRVHTGEKPYNCLMCQKHYQQKNDLNRHLKKKHGVHNKNNLR